MGLDLHLYVIADDHERLHAGRSYGGFNEFRRRVADDAGLGDIEQYEGFGGARRWPSSDDEPLVPFLRHSDCDGQLLGWEVPGLGYRLRSICAAWPDGFERAYGLKVAAMFERAEREDALVVFS